MSQEPRVRNEQESAPELAYNIDQLEDLVSNSKRLPMSHKVIVDEDEFIQLMDEIRSSIPMEIRDAQRLLKERERLIGEAQDQAARIISDAQRRASVLVSEHTILNEAKQHGEELLREAEKQRQEAQGRMEVFLLQQVTAIRNAALATMGNMESTVERSLNALKQAEAAIGADPDEGP